MNVLVTGGVSGIGGAITRRLARDPATVVIATYCTSASAAADLSNEFGNVTTVACDFRDAASIQSLVARVDEWALDGLVNNAMLPLRRVHFHKLAVDEFRRGFDENVVPVVAITQAALARFRKARAGRIVTILSSYMINRPPVGLSEYVASKAYLASLARSWAVENAQFGITSNCVSPSMIRTNLVADLDGGTIASAEQEHPLRRLLTAPEVAEAVEFLLKSSPHINGVNLAMNAAVDFS